MVNEGRGRLFKRSDDKYLIYLPVGLAEDSMFPFQNWQDGRRSGQKNTIPVKVSFKPSEGQRLIIEEWKEPKEQ